MSQAARFLKNEKLMATWPPTYDRDLALLNGEDIQKILDRSSVRKEA
jgi:hypothetical protein